LFPLFSELLIYRYVEVHEDAYLKKIIDLVKERCVLIPDFYEQAVYFFQSPEKLDLDAIKPKWNDAKTNFFETFCNSINEISWTTVDIETVFKNLATEMNIKPGELQLPMRIMLVGGKFGPAVFEIAHLIEKEETILRIKNALTLLNS